MSSLSSFTLLKRSSAFPPLLLLQLLLPQTQAEVITLFYFERLSVKEIAGITGKTPDNVKVILCRARESLRKKLEV